MGLPVISLDTGAQVGQIKDLLFDASTRRLSGVVLEQEGWLREARVLPFERLVSVGPDAVTVPDKEAIGPMDAVPQLRDHSQSSLQKTRGKKVFTAGGAELGTVEDIVVGLPEGYMAGLELSGGLINDVVKGRAFLPEEDIITFGQDALIVSDTASGLWQQLEA